MIKYRYRWHHFLGLILTVAVFASLNRTFVSYPGRNSVDGKARKQAQESKNSIRLWAEKDSPEQLIQPMGLDILNDNETDPKKKIYVGLPSSELTPDTLKTRPHKDDYLRDQHGGNLHNSDSSVANKKTSTGFKIASFSAYESDKMSLDPEKEAVDTENQGTGNLYFKSPNGKGSHQTTSTVQPVKPQNIDSKSNQNSNVIQETLKPNDNAPQDNIAINRSIADSEGSKNTMRKIAQLIASDPLLANQLDSLRESPKQQQQTVETPKNESQPEEIKESFHMVINEEKSKKTCPKKYGKVGIITFYTNSAQYMHATTVMWCYALSRGYEFFLVQPFEDELSKSKCSRYPDVMFRKHCVAAEYVEKVDFLYVMDADTGVVNADHCLEEWIEPSVDILLYERFFSAEVMSGHYVAKNTPAAQRFMREWAEISITDPSPPGYFFSADNGAVHLLVLRLLFPKEKEMIRNCLSKVTLSKWPDWEPAYGAFVWCAKSKMISYDPQVMGPSWARVKMLPRAQAWVRDIYLSDWDLWSGDFMGHNIKNTEPYDIPMLQRLKLLWTNAIPAECLQPSWAPKLARGKILPTEDILGRLNASAISLKDMKLKTLFANPQWDLCWPKCPPVFQSFSQ